MTIKSQLSPRERVTHEENMRRAIRQAEHALDRGDRPFGCVIVAPSGAVLAEAGGSEAYNDPTHHCEVDAIRFACWRARGRLQGCTLYSTHEPCVMCIGAILHAKVSRVVFGSFREDMPSRFRQRRHGVYALLADTSTPPQVQGGVLRSACVELFYSFYTAGGLSRSE